MSDITGGDDGSTLVRVQTVGLKRRGVLRVLKHALHDAQREMGRDRVTGLFGLVVREDGTVSLLSAVTTVEMDLVMKAMPGALNHVATQLVKGKGKGS